MNPLRRWLASANPAVVTYYATCVAFGAYFCMYAFRKPFAAATFDGPSVAFVGISVAPKTLLVVAQIIGYAVSKYVGVRVCSETRPDLRAWMLVGLVVASHAALLAFAAIPETQPWLRAAALFGNGLPLGMVWGLVVGYLEGRRQSEVLLTGLACSFIVASGVVKDIGRALLAGADFALPTPESWALAAPNPFPPIAEEWMPFAVGALFLPTFLLFVGLLEQIPAPSDADIAAQTRRQPMGPAERAEFVSRYAVALVLAIAAYLLLTAFRDYRDNYAVEVFQQLGYDYESNQTIVSRSEFLVALAVMAVVSQLYRIADNRRALVAIYGVMIGGLLAAGAATAMRDAGRIDGFWWMTIIGLGGYMAYVPFNAVLFDRVIAHTGFVGTAVFGIYLADAAGYTGSVVLQLGKDAIGSQADHVGVLRAVSYALASIGSVCLAGSLIDFLRNGRKPANASPRFRAPESPDRNASR